MSLPLRFVSRTSSSKYNQAHRYHLQVLRKLFSESLQAAKGGNHSTPLAPHTDTAARVRPSVVPATTYAGKISSRSALVARHLSASPSYPSAVDKRPLPETDMPSKYTVRKVGAPNTLEHRIYIEKDGIPISPFHDIPLYANEQQTVLNMIVEIPRWTNGKLEVSLAHSLSLLLLF
jgi:hypothetical protein